MDINRKDLFMFLDGIANFFSSQPYCMEDVLDEDAMRAYRKLRRAPHAKRRKRIQKENNDA